MSGPSKFFGSIGTRLSVMIGLLGLSIGVVLVAEAPAQKRAKRPNAKKNLQRPSMAGRSTSERDKDKLDIKIAPDTKKITISTGTPVRPSEFNGDVSSLSSVVTEAGRRRFASKPEFNIEPSGSKFEIEPQNPPPAADTLVPAAPMPTPLQSFDGMNLSSNGAGWPPDTVGDVGVNHYIQSVNSSVRIFNKTGTTLATFTFDALWAGAGSGTSCDNANQGDPTVVYVPQYARFVVADFAWTNTQNGPYYECVAVSKTSDPVAGGWWLYAIRSDDAAHPWLPDYPKMGIWRDALYMGTNMFDCLNVDCSSATYQGARAYAFNIAKMVNGTALTANDIQVADMGTSQFTVIPATYTGKLPPLGTPNYFVGESQTIYAWNVFKFSVNFTTPASTTFTGPTTVSQTSYTGAAGTVATPSPGDALDTLADRLMMQVQYKNLTSSESLWVNHTVGAPTAAQVGIQWAQLNVTGGAVAAAPVQQQIFNNGADGLRRFIGSMAVDNGGNMALGYTVASSAVAPDIRYSGRLASDALGTLPQTETTMLPGVTRSVQTGSIGRWGDYSAMSLDPADNCTFWYTHEYYPVQGSNWVTRVGTFKFASCVTAPTAATVGLAGRVLTADGRGIRNAEVTLVDSTGQVKRTLTSSFGYYQLDGLAAGSSYTISVTSKRYVVLPRTINLSDDVTDLDFIAEGQIENGKLPSTK